MNNEKKLRLIQVAKEFQVGLSSIADFLHKKGVSIEASPNTPITPEIYAIVEKEFGANRPSKNERDSVREKISMKPTTISIEEEPKPAPKATTIEVKSEIQQPKFLGKIDLDKHNEPVKPKQEPAKSAEPKQEVKKQEQLKKEKVAEPKQDAAVQAEKPKNTESEQPVKTETPIVEQQPEQKAQEPTETEEPKQSEVFRATETPTLAGPQILGKMDVSGIVPGGRHKRKRLDKEKVDVNKQQSNNKGNSGKNGGGNNAFGKQQEGGKKKKDKKNQPKPVIRPEVSDEEVSKQIKDTLARLTAKGSTNKKGAKYRKEKREEVRERMNEEFEREEQERKILKVTEFVTVSELATMMNISPMEVISACMNLGLMVSINQRLDAEALVVVAEEFGFKTEFVSVEIQEAIEDSEEDNNEENLVPRPPIVTVMGHVDHGKTSLLDNIRKTNVIAGEAGGITQHIGAYSVELNGQKITFLDTPGHEAFTAMRARGAKITDVAIIIVAADDNVMPQTVEAINHAQAAGVPMVFAINKIDKPNANPDHIKEQLANMNYLVEDWGGKYQSQDISAKKGLNLDKLLEKVLLEAELLDLKANPHRKAKGAVIESTLDKGRGYVATVLVQDGTLRVGDVVLSGTYTGRVKAMFDENGKKVTEAGPSTPVQLLGLNGAPQAGDSFNVMDDDRSAREIANKREQLQRMQGIMTQKHVTLDEIGRRIAIGSFKELNIIVKGDVDGSVEAMAGSLIKLSKETVQVNVIHAAVGQISESDVLLAAASNAIIVGFQVRPSAAARKTAEKEEIEIRLYSIIYDAINDIKDAIEGMLEPVMKEEIVCSIEVMEIFKISKVGTVAGCIVREGKLQRNTPIRVIRDGIVIHTGRLGSLKRFKDDVKEVVSGQDCGLNIESYNDIRVGDIVEGYEQVEVKRK
ncbi:MAG: translation initiation factor IF-2 [Alistipes sp.]